MKKLLLLSFHRTALLLLPLAALFVSAVSLNAQIIYANVGDINGQIFIYKIDLATCTFCPVTPASFNVGGFDIVLLPDGTILNISGPTLVRTQPPPSTQIIWQNNPGQFYLSAQLAPNGLVYLGGGSGLGVFNPATNTVNYLGNWPAGFNSMGDIFYIDGVLYGILVDVNFNVVLVEVNVSNPALSTIVGPLFSTFGAEGGTWNGTPGLFYTDHLFDLYFYDPNTGNSTLICDIPLGFSIVGLTFPPPGVPEFPCLTICTTNAGTLPAGGPYNTCTNATLNFPPATGTVLEANDLLQYVLFTNPSDTAGSIVATNATPSFTFNPATMQTGVTYYIAAMAGNNLGGNIDLNDPCLDFSNALQLIWRPLPTVAFNLAPGNAPDLCPGQCRTVVLNFTGSPPFNLTYTSPTGSVTQTFATNSGAIQVCAPSGAPAGPLSLQATVLSDVWCVCQ